jgi:hypothetical protein
MWASAESKKLNGTFCGPPTLLTKIVAKPVAANWYDNTADVPLFETIVAVSPLIVTVPVSPLVKV